MTVIFQRKYKLSLHLSDPVLNVPKKSVFIPTPFISHKCNSDIKMKLRRTCAELYRQFNLKIMFSNKLSIESLLKFKDQILVDLLRNIVYPSKYSQCEATYVEKLLVASTIVLLIISCFFSK